MKKKQKQLMPEVYRRRMDRADERPLLILVLVFQFLSFGLLGFKAEEVCVFSLRTAFLLPLCTYGAYRLFIKKIHADRMLFILTAFLCSLGVVLLTAVFDDSGNASKQLIMVALGFMVMPLGMHITRVLTGDEGFIDGGMLIAAIMLAITLFTPSASSSKSWFRFGPVQIQPSELVKPLMIVILSAGYTHRRGIKRSVVYTAFSAAMCVILVLQPDLGAVFLYFLLTVALYWAGTGRFKTVIFMVLGSAAAAALLLYFMSGSGGRFGYVITRLKAFLDPFGDEYNTSRQLPQGLMSIASGGWFGTGLGLSRARMVSVVESDYIFAALSEEFGMLFTLCVIAVYAVIVFKGIQIALNARSRFHALIAFGCVFQLASQAALIILGNLCLIPLTGVTLPFISAGGSSMLSGCLIMGMLLGVSSINAEDEYDDLMKLSKGRWEETDT